MDKVGRPRATTHAEIQAIARRLFHNQGYATTSLATIAKAAGISRTALFSYFPTKGDLIWGEYHATTARLHHALANRPPGEPVDTSILSAVCEAMSFPVEDHDSLAYRWEIVDRNPELHSASAERLEAHKRALAAFIAERRGEPPTAFLPRVVSEAVFGASTGGARYWACTSPVCGPMADYVAAAVKPVLDGFRDQLWTRPPEPQP